MNLSYPGYLTSPACPQPYRRNAGRLCAAFVDFVPAHHNDVAVDVYAGILQQRGDE